jgi:hypothetical protein
MKLLKLFPVIFLVLFYQGCEKEDNTVLNEELIFRNSYEIKIPPFKYALLQGDTIYVRGDLSFNSDIIDTVPSTPVLSWEPVESEIVCAAIFKESIQSDNHLITNDTSDIVWIWHSGLSAGKNGLVKFEQGVSEIDPVKPESDLRAEPLNQGQIYYWAVWAWDNSGIEINFSSRELKFVVK